MNQSAPTWNGCIQSVLYPSPYSGCGNFSGWPKKTCNGPRSWTPATPSNVPGARLCVDRFPKAAGGQVLQKVHHRPSLPYPGAILGPGTQGLKPMPHIIRAPTPRPAYNLHAIAGPSSLGPFTVLESWDPWIGDENFTGGVSRGAWHSLGVS